MGLFLVLNEAEAAALGAILAYEEEAIKRGIRLDNHGRLLRLDSASERQWIDDVRLVRDRLDVAIADKAQTMAEREIARRQHLPPGAMP